MEKHKFSFIDLFSGIGGFRLALENIGGKCIHFSEINTDAIDSYCLNTEGYTNNNLGDITQIKALPPHNLLTAGVPCQSWSIAGRNLGFDDDRGQLWNDTIYLLKQSKPDVFIFENVKGLADPRNEKALILILDKIKDAGYFVNYYVLNSFDYGVPQNRIRLYIVGFRNKDFSLKFKLPPPVDKKNKLASILTDFDNTIDTKQGQQNLFGEMINNKSMSLSSSYGFNDYFLFNDLRNGHSTIHSWDIIETTDRQKYICYLLLKNRRKRLYGCLDGNPLSLNHFVNLDASITQSEIDELVDIDIMKKEDYLFEVVESNIKDLDENETILLNHNKNNIINIDVLKNDKKLKIQKISILKTISNLKRKEIILCTEVRYDFKNTKISTGLLGINRIFLPTSNIFPTLVASDTNDYIATQVINAKNNFDFKRKFIENIYMKKQYRKITKEEACLIQGFPRDYILPESRARWMKLLGNSVSVPVIERIGQAILDTGVFDYTNTVDHLHDCNSNLEHEYQ